MRQGPSQDPSPDIGGRHTTVRLHDVAAQPWGSGGGVTRELLSWPLHRAITTPWCLRVSVARINQSGGFSPFPGVVRWFAVLAGAGVRLHLPRGDRTVMCDDEPLQFDGEAAPMCDLLEGATLDLNLMAQRDAGQARLQRAHAGSHIDGPTLWRGLYAAGTALLVIDGVTEPVAEHTLVWTDEQTSSAWWLHAASTGPCWWLTLES